MGRVVVDWGVPAWTQEDDAMGYKPSDHVKQLPQRKTFFSMASKETKELYQLSLDCGIRVETWIARMEDWLKANGQKAKACRTAAKDLKVLDKTDVKLFQGYVKTVEAIAAVEAEIQKIGKPGADKDKQKALKALEKKHRQLVQQADASHAAQETNLKAMVKARDVIYACDALDPPAL